MKKIECLTKKIKVFICVAMVNLLMAAESVYANDNVPKFVSGSKKLFADLAKWAALLIGGVTVVVALVNGFKWIAANEDEKPRKQKAVINTLLIGGILTCIPSIVALVLSYYE